MTDPRTLPDDDPSRTLTIVDDDHPAAGWISVAGGTYTMLITGEQTAGQYCLIDMRVPDGGGPPLHRHDFEELFVILEGELEFTFRGEQRTASAGSSVNIPANAPHRFQNRSGASVRMLCVCTPAAQEEYFLRVGDPVPGPTAAPPELSDEEKQERASLAARLAAQYRTQILG